MKRLVTMMKTSAAVAAMVVALGSTAHADRFVGAAGGTDTLPGGDGVSWEDPANWEGDLVPLNASTNILIGADHQVVFDADTWAFLQANDSELTPYLQNATEHRIARLLMGDSTSGAFNGSHSLTLDQGAGNTIRATNSNSAVFAARPGKTATLNVVSGIANIEAGRFRVGQGLDASGTINLSGGELILGRGGLELSGTDGNGEGTLNITGGSFTTRNDVEIFNGGMFHVAGSTATNIGIGSHASLDGSWTQSTGGILRVGLDAGGLTSILIDDVDDDGAGSQGNVIFESGSILDPYDAGSANNAWTTVMTWEGTLDNGGSNDNLVLSTDATTAGWEMQIVGNQLQVRNPNFPDPPVGEPGDFDLDGDVDLADLDQYNGNIGAAAVGPLAALDLDEDGTVDAGDFQTHYTTLVDTSNGQKGTFAGDVNLDGTVNVLGDAFPLVGNLNTAATSWSQGDLNGDGTVNVLGDAFVLIGNLGNTNNP